jgi:aminoglycoside phosphotransferase (APT) family kinase protein
MKKQERGMGKHHMKLAATLIKHYFGKKKAKATELTGGLTNSVILIQTGNDELVVRMSDEPEKINSFLKEQWAVAQAKQKNIPVPEILEVGNTIIPVPYMIMRKIEGEEATHHEKRSEIIQKMGEYAAQIHTISTRQYGNAFDWSQNTLSKNATWKSYLDDELHVKERLASLQKNKMLPSKAIPVIKRVIRSISMWTGRPCLHHGDLRLKNVMVDKDGKILSIIDWENCISSIAPFWDLSIALHDLSIDRQGLFLQGYKITGKQIIKMAPVLKLFNVLNYAPEVERMAAAKEKENLDLYRARLHGALDMYSW